MSRTKQHYVVAAYSCSQSFNQLQICNESVGTFKMHNSLTIFQYFAEKVQRSCVCPSFQERLWLTCESTATNYILISRWIISYCFFWEKKNCIKGWKGKKREFGKQSRPQLIKKKNLLCLDPIFTVASKNVRFLKFTKSFICKAEIMIVDIRRWSNIASCSTSTRES